VAPQSRVYDRERGRSDKQTLLTDTNSRLFISGLGTYRHWHIDSPGRVWHRSLAGGKETEMGACKAQVSITRLST
jgi:hypothetical protein